MAGEYFRFPYNVIICSTIFLVSLYCTVALLERRKKKKRNAKREAAKTNAASETSEISVCQTRIQVASVVISDQSGDSDDLDQSNLYSDEASFHQDAPDGDAENNPLPVSLVRTNDHNSGDLTNETLDETFQVRLYKQLAQIRMLMYRFQDPVNQLDQSDSVSVNRPDQSEIHNRSTNLVMSDRIDQGHATVSTVSTIDRSLRARAKQKKTYRNRRTHPVSGTK